MKETEIELFEHIKSHFNKPYAILYTNSGFEGGFPNCIVSSHQKKNVRDFTDLASIIEKEHEDVYGFLTYDLKNEVHGLNSANPAVIHFSPLLFFEAEDKTDFDVSTFQKIKSEALDFKVQSFYQHTTKATYVEHVRQIKQLIEEGEVYELNYCIAFSFAVSDFDPIRYFLEQTKNSPAPFSCLLKEENNFLLCASPERFIKKEKEKVYSQPIKGTIMRGATPEKDVANKQYLLNSEKEKAENLMIVDLVRNDLAQTAIPGSIKVDELFGIYSFRHVHQMISTVSAHVSPTTNPVNVIKHAFPMGSMTGAPKYSAMKYIDQFETFQRNLFSGSVGYFTKENDFDFNVVIRSMLFDQSTNQIIVRVGSAITYDADPEAEYEECMLKAQALIKPFLSQLNHTDILS